MFKNLVKRTITAINVYGSAMTLTSTNELSSTLSEISNSNANIHIAYGLINPLMIEFSFHTEKGRSGIFLISRELFKKALASYKNVGVTEGQSTLRTVNNKIEITNVSTDLRNGTSVCLTLPVSYARKMMKKIESICPNLEEANKIMIDNLIRRILDESKS